MAWHGMGPGGTGWGDRNGVSCYSLSCSFSSLVVDDASARNGMKWNGVEWMYAK